MLHRASPAICLGLLISSQISSLAPTLAGCWDKQCGSPWPRDLLRTVQPARWITHQIPIDRADQAREPLNHPLEDCIQILLTCPG